MKGGDVRGSENSAVKINAARPAASASSSAQSAARRLEVARYRLSRFIEQQAEEAADRLGFGWVGQPDAPDDFDSLTAAFERSIAGRLPLPVSNQHCDASIYDSPQTNMALRFWHDISHVELGLSFEVLDELELALYHLRVLELAGFRRRGLVWQLLHADLVGQAYLIAIGHAFPADQQTFVKTCLQSGFDEGLLAEGRRLVKLNIQSEDHSGP